MVDRMGQQLGNYRLIRLLGKGGFAEVYLGEHVYLKTPGAIKLLQTNVSNPEDLDGFLKEAQTIAQLVHPHIVRVMDFGVDGDTPFLVMDYALGGTLRQRHPKGSQLPLTTILPYVKQVAEALSYAHEEKFIHRDVKPENMLVGRREAVLLSDFGIALIAQSSRYQSTQEVIGTVAYMSPEQIQGKPRPASDQYSLAIVVYEWLSGDRPFHGSFTELCTQHLFAPPPPLLEKVPTLAPAVEEVVLTALAKDPHQRFGSVQAFATALEQASQVEATDETIPASQSVSPTDERTVLKLQQPTEPIIRPGESFIPTELTAPASPPSLPSGVGMPASEMSLALEQASQIEISQTLPAGRSPQPTDAQTAPSQSSIPTKLATPASRTSVSTEAITPLRPPAVPAQSVSPQQPPMASPSKPMKALLPRGTVLCIYRGHSDVVQSLAWSSDGTHIASGGDDKTVQVWNAANGSLLFTYRGHTKSIRGYVQAVAWSPDGTRIASAAKDTTVQVWNVGNVDPLYTYRRHDTWVGVVTAIAWSPDGTLIASASKDKTVQVWNAADGSLLFTYQGHSDQVHTVAWSPDGQRIASGSADKTLQVWQAV